MRIRLSFLILFLMIFDGYSQIQRTQIQRMVVLPTSMQYGSSKEIVRTLCVDYFRPAPKQGDIYNTVINFSRSNKVVVNGRKPITTRKFLRKYQLEGLAGPSAMIFKSGAEGLESILEPFLISQEKEDIPNAYLDFIESKISKYKADFSYIEHNILQREIWEYNILDQLGYISGNDPPDVSYEQGKALFIKEFGGEISTAATELTNSIHNNYSTQSYKTYYIRKNTSNSSYMLFSDISPPNYKGSNEYALMDEILRSASDNDNIYIMLSGFESPEKEEAFFSTLKIQNYSKTPDKNIDIFKHPGKDFFSEKDYTLVNQPSSKEYNQVTIGEKTYFKQSYEFLSSIDESLEFNTTQIDALSTKKTILDKLTDKINKVFATYEAKISLGLFLNSFRKEIKQARLINSDRDFLFYLKDETISMKIVKLDNHRNLIVILND